MDITSADIAPSQDHRHAHAHATPTSQRLNGIVAVTMALLATFMALCQVKDDNIVQAMQQAQADKIDHWAFYQARNIRQEIAEAMVTELELSRSTVTPSQASIFDPAIARYQQLATDQNRKKDDLKIRAEQDQRDYETLNERGNQFDVCHALLAIAIAMLAVTALVQIWSLYWAALLPTVLGVAMGVAGLAGWSWQLEFLNRWLS